MFQTNNNKSCCNTITYFSSQNNASNNQMCKNQDQVTEYRTLISYLEKHECFQELFKNEENHLLQSGLAFYIESKKQIGIPNEQQLDLIEKINQIWAEHKDEPEESFKRTTWILTDLIYNMYKTLLEYKLLTDNSNHRLIGMQLTTLQSSQKFSTHLKNIGQPITSTGINKSYLPDWFFKHFPDHMPILIRNHPNP